VEPYFEDWRPVEETALLEGPGFAP
jgi:hypothetical protein